MTDYYVGLDLGQTVDFTALAILERAAPDDEAIYSLRHVQRFHLGTDYTAIIQVVSKLVNTKPLDGCSTLVIDQTGVGRPVIDMFRRFPMSARIVPITITSGRAIKASEDGMHVPKKPLVTCLLGLLQNRRLQIPRKLPEANLLTREMLNFQMRITPSANEVFGTRRGEHDDIVLAIALACWFAEHEPSLSNSGLNGRSRRSS
jgi:hypothetical protein